MAMFKGQRALATDLNKVAGNYILASDNNKTQGGFITGTDYGATIIAHQTSGYQSGYSCNPYNPVGYAINVGGPYDAIYILIQLSNCITTSGTNYKLSFHYSFGQKSKNASGNSALNEGQLVTGRFQVGYGSAGGSDFTVLWTLNSNGDYYEDIGNYGDKTVNFASSIPNGSVVKMKVTKFGTYFGYTARVTNLDWSIT